MTIIKASDLDNQMSRHIDPNSVPRHDGGDQGVMEGQFLPQSSLQTSHSQVDRRGAPVFDDKELLSQNYFGSQTVISVNDAPPLMKQFEPTAKPVTVPVKPLAAAPAPKPVVPPAPPKAVHPLLQVAPIRSVSAPPVLVKQVPQAAPAAPRTAQDLLKSMGLKKA